MNGTARNSGIFVLLILLAASLLLVWNGRSRYAQYLDHETRLAERSTAGAASEIALLVEELRRRVLLFADEEADLIQAVAANPADQTLPAALSARLDRHFSDRFAFAIAGQDGATMVDDFDNLVGELCRSDILSFASGTHEHRVYLHPQPGAYHFDIMARLERGDGPAGVFFVSFHPTMIARVLGNSELPGHSLLLMHREPTGLIEVAARGARDQLHREIRLSPEEIDRIASRVPVAGTEWLLVDVPSAALHSRVRDEIWRETGMFIVALVGIALVMLRFLRRSEHQRFAAEGRLRRTQHELETRMRDRTQRLTQTNTELQRQIQERRAAERTLREREGTLRAILATAVDAIVVIDDHGIVQSFNGAAERIFGYDAAEVIGQNVNRLMPAPYRDEHDGYIHSYLATHEARIIGIGREVTALHKNGATFPVHLAVSEVDLGSRKLFAGILRDLSEKR